MREEKLLKISDAVRYGMEYLNGNIKEPRLEAELLLSYVLNVDRTYIIVNRDKELSPDDIKRFFDLLEMRKENIPYQYIVGKKYFMGLIFNVSPSVLIPRNDTEILVEEVLKRLKNGDAVLDIGTGSGAIAVSIAKYKDVQVFAVDISIDALKIARENAIMNNVEDKVTFIRSDLYSSLPNNVKFDVIVSNPPYIRSNEIKDLQEEVKKEPIIALDGGEDGLDFYRRIIKDSHNYMKKDAIMAFEVGYDQAQDVENLLKNYGYSHIEIIKDLQGIDRVLIGK